MANCLTEGYSITCTEGGCSGGIGNIYFAPAADVATITYDPDGSVTAEAMAVANCNIVVEQSITWIDPCRNDTLRQRIEELANCCCGMIVIHTELTGVTWIWGDFVRRRARLATNDATSGTALADQNQEAMTVTASASKKAVAFTGVVPLV
jgi:hypothetical protein